MKYILALMIQLSILKTAFCQVVLSKESIQSLYLETYNNNKYLGQATGFIIKSKTQYYLITNWHVVTNKHPFTKNWINDSTKLSPNKIIIYHRRKDLKNMTIREEILFDKNGIKYIEYNNGNEMFDVVALPLKDTSGNIGIFPIEYNDNVFDSTMVMKPSETVFVVGFPLGKTPTP